MTFLPGDQYTDAPLTIAAVGAVQKDDNFVALQAAPRLKVTKPTGLYYKWKMGDFNRDEVAAQGPSSKPHIGTFGKTNATFSVLSRALGYDMNDFAKAAADIAIDPSKAIPRVLANKALIKMERMLAAQFDSAKVYRNVTGADSDSIAEGATSSRKYWDDTSVNVVKGIRQEVQFQGKLSGFEPTGMIFGRALWSAIESNPYVISALAGLGGLPVISNAPPSLDQAAKLFGLSWCGVSRAIYNTALENETPTNDYIIPEDGALLYYRQPGAAGAAAGEYDDQMPTGLARFCWQDAVGNAEGIRIRTFRDENAGPGGSDRSVLEMVNEFDVVTAEMCTLFTAMLTP